MTTRTITTIIIINNKLYYSLIIIIDTTVSHEESQLYGELSALLVQPGPNLLRSLKNYKSASQEVRNAIASPTQENEDIAWRAVLPIVDMLREFYGYSSDLSK